MSYIRVIPRDLFNEANLLKCYAKIYINLETAGLPHVELDHDGDAFDVQQDEASGGTYIANVALKVAGEEYRLHRPLNSREDWPLYLTDGNEEEIPVFSKDGTFSPDILDFFNSKQNLRARPGGPG